MRTSSSTFLVRLFACSLLALAAACGDTSESMNFDAEQALSMDEIPYYIYDGQPVYLDVDPSRLTVVTHRAVSEKTLRASLSAVGFNEARLESVSMDSDAFIVHLPQETSPRDAIDAAKALREDGLYSFVANTYRAQESGDAIVLHNRLVVHLKDGAGSEVIARLNRELGTRLLQEPQGGSEEYILAYPSGVDPLSFALLCAEQPEVEWVDPDKTAERRLHAVPSDPFFTNQYYARSTTTRNGVRVDDNVEWAWDLTYGAWSAAAGPLIVAVIDDGVQTSHPDLDSTYILGYDAFTNSWGSYNCSNCATNPSDSPSHGTLVAGVIKAQHNNGIGLAGLAPAVKLLPIRIFRNGVAASDSQIAMGIDAAWQNNAHVLSNSWGGGSPSNTITAAINRATTQGRGGKGSVVVFSAGNTSDRAHSIVGGVTYPATLSNVLAVGAINRSGTLTNYTAEGSALDLVAPSGHNTGMCIGDVVTTDLLGTRGCNDGPGGNIDYSGTFSGTSAAAPQVSAVAAMVLSRSPTLTEAQVRSQITANADPWGSSTQFGSGKLNAYRALVGRTKVTISGSGRPSTAGTYTYTANASGGVGGYTYAWAVSYNNGPFSSTCSGASSCSLYVGSNADIDLRVTVVNGPDNQQVSTTKAILGPVSCVQTQKGTDSLIICP